MKSPSVKEPKKIDEDKLLDLAFQFHTARAAGHPDFQDKPTRKAEQLDAKLAWEMKLRYPRLKSELQRHKMATTARIPTKAMLLGFEPDRLIGGSTA